MADANEIVTTRVIDAPREEVFGAFRNPERLARWWGPRGFTNEFEEFDLRPGGEWRLVMRGPDGSEYRMTKRFIDVVAGERVVLRHVQEGHGFRMEMSFADEPGGTRLDWRMQFDSLEESVRKVVVEANEENLDRLQELLASHGDTEAQR
ncbi:MAG TPA: SRPBCC family protein [Longimicrobium sp.]